MKRVVIESPYSGDIRVNLEYAREAMAHSLHKNEAPIASHLLYTQQGILDDSIPGERAIGMTAGFLWNELADLVAVYEDLGISRGMWDGIMFARDRNIPVDFRRIR